MRVVTIERTAIDRFKAQWPCRNIPGDCDCFGLHQPADLIVAVFAENGDLIDYQISDHADNVIVEADFPGGDFPADAPARDTGEALSALFSAAQERAVNKGWADTDDYWVYA